MIQADIAEQHELALARIDHATAAEHILTDLELGGNIVMAPMHIEWHDLANTVKLLIIEAPRDHGKTEQMVISRVISELGKNPELRIKIVCENDELAKARVKAIGQHIKENAKVRAIWSRLRPASQQDWSKHRIIVKRSRVGKDASVEAYGVLTNAGGGRADLIIFDDICGFRNTISQPALRDQVKQSVRNVWLNMLEPTGRAIYIFTPWHKDDLSAELKDDGAWRLASYAVNESHEGPWPRKWTVARLKEREREIGLRAYQRGYQLKALTDEEAVFSEEVVEGAYDWDVSLGQDYPTDWPRIAGVDLAASLRQRGAFTVMFTAVLTPEGKRIPIEILRYKQPFDSTVEMIHSAWQRHHHSLIMVENNSYQEVLVQHLANKHSEIPVESFTTGSNKHHLELGLPGFLVQLRNRTWIVPKGGCTGGSDCRCLVCIWVKEMLGYPVATTSDVVMAWWLSECAVRYMQSLVQRLKEQQEQGPNQSTVVLNPLQAGEGPLSEFGHELPDTPPSWLGADE